jgi:hypothetical protein
MRTPRITRTRRLLRKLNRAIKRECEHTAAARVLPYGGEERQEQFHRSYRAAKWKLAWWDLIESHASRLLNGSVHL